jgi:hypothetical protein
VRGKKVPVFDRFGATFVPFTCSGMCVIILFKQAYLKGAAMAVRVAVSLKTG